MTVTDGILLGLGVALGLLALPPLVRALARLTLSLLRAVWWAAAWLLTVRAQRGAETPEIAKLLSECRELTAACFLLAWFHSAEAGRDRGQLIERWQELCAEVAELRLAARRAAS